jgi:hypothetical protein
LYRLVQEEENNDQLQDGNQRHLGEEGNQITN